MIKLSNLSNAVFKTLAIRVIFDLIYLVYLLLFRLLHLFSHNGYFFFFFISDQLIEAGVFYATLCVFVQGYLTIHFDKKILYNGFAIVTTLLYTVVVFAVRVYVKCANIEDFYYDDGLYEFKFKDRSINFVILISVCTIIGRIGLFILISKQFWTSYKESNRNEKFLKGF